MMTNGDPVSPNFGFLSKYDGPLLLLAANAERYCFDDPNTSLIKARQFAEELARSAAARVGVSATPEDSQLDVLRSLEDRRALPREVLELFHRIRKVGNRAVHDHSGSRSDALQVLKWARQAAVWFHRGIGGQKGFKAGPFVPPPDPSGVDRELRETLEALRERLASQEAETDAALVAAQDARHLREKAEADAAKAYSDLQAALELAEQSEAQIAEQQAFYEAALNEQQAAAEADPGAVQQLLADAQAAGADLDLDEADTRALIDEQLRDAGWEVDSQSKRWSKGIRPQRGKNIAIGEVPTATGPADYVLYCGLTPMAVVEAKRQNRNSAGAIEQAKRYSRGYTIETGQESPGGPWGEYRIPFLFSTNGNPYLKQIIDQSGTWFLDARRETNHAHPLDGWYTPEGLQKLLALDHAAAEDRLARESFDYLPLRYYQRDAIKAAEKAIADGNSAALLAMATGTGKTRTCIGLIYRLLKAGRFRRVLFLVDRTTLGDQAADVFRTLKIENLQAFSDIYDVKELGDIRPEGDTRLHIATIQGMIRRTLFNGEDEPPMPVDSYDYIVVDECHRGYNLDQEMSDAELTFRSQDEYVSKYTRVLEYFDAFKVALTATPALHTTEIFGPPVYDYSYRKAVIDGYLVDHDPPLRIVTKLAEDGITWDAGEEITVLNTRSGQVEMFRTPDELDVEIEQFNTKVQTEPFNRVVCETLAGHIDPTLPGKTLVFCATDLHADMVVRLLKEAFDQRYGSVDDNAVVKITGKADKPKELIRRLKNERLPSVVVTVDLLTTGVDVPELDKLVFLRRIKSRILYEQMLGRATRLCPSLHGPGDDKEAFQIFDAVDLYSVLEPYSSMRPVVNRPNIKFEQMVSEILEADDSETRTEIQAQFIAKLRRKIGRLDSEMSSMFQAESGHQPTDFLDVFASMSSDAAAEYLRDHPDLGPFLDRRLPSDPRRMIVAPHDDEVRRVETGYGTGGKPADYLEQFREFVESHKNEIPALLAVMQRPRDLTRADLRALQLELDKAGFREREIRRAYRETTNQDIAATIIGFIRGQALGSSLIPYEDRVRAAMARIVSSRRWSTPQRKWLERIGKQLVKETVVDRASLDSGQFKQDGGFNRINKVFDGELESLLGEIGDEVWKESA